MKIAVTGASGFIGSALLPLLLTRGDDVVAIVRDRQSIALPCTVIEADLTDGIQDDRLKEALAGCETLIHLAAAIPAASIPTDDADTMTRINVDATMRLLRQLPPSITHVILASTLDIYGAPQTLPLTETHPLHPESAYARSKVACEQEASAFCDTEQIPLTILRFTQVYGPRERPIKAIPLFVRAIASGTAPNLFGDGSDLRDYLFVDDAAKAIVAAVDTQAAGIFNIASGTSVSIKDTVEMLIRISGQDLQPQMQERKKPKIDIAFDVSAAEKTLGFRAQTSLPDGLQKTYAWYHTHRT